MDQIATIGLDIAKTVFQVHGIDGRTRERDHVDAVVEFDSYHVSLPARPPLGRGLTAPRYGASVSATLSASSKRTDARRAEATIMPTAASTTPPPMI